MKLDSEENASSKDPNIHIDMPSKLPSINNQENQVKQNQNSSSKKITEIKLNKEKSLSSLKLKITEHQEILSKESLPELHIFSEEQNTDQDNILYPNDFYSEESKKSQPKIIEGKGVININEIIGEETEQPISLQMIDDNSITLPMSKISAKSFGLITSYAANTYKGIVRDYNEDRVSININVTKPKNSNYTGQWPKITYFGIFDGHAGNKCAEFLRNNLLNFITNNHHFPTNIPNAIKHGFKKIDEEYLTKYAYVNNKLEDNSGSCGLILLLVNNKIYIANVGDSRCVGSFKNGKLRKDITLDHKPNSPLEKERITKSGGRIYQTQTPIDDDESYKDKILVGPYRVFPGKLSVSRTVGDAEGKLEVLGGNPHVLVPVPDIFTFDLEKDDVDFFIMGCDGIYDQLSSKEILNCAWMVLNNNLELYKKKLEGKNVVNNIFKGNYGNEMNMNNISGNIVDFILKASMIRKSFDNVTCLFISFKDFFHIVKKDIDNQVHKSKEFLLRNKSNIENINNNLIETEVISDKSNNQKSIKVEKEEDDLLYKNNDNIKRLKSPFLNGKKAIRINSLPKQAFTNINPILNSNKIKSEDDIVNLSTSHNKNMTVNNIITYNNNIILNSDNSNTNINNNLNNVRLKGNSFNEKIINNHHNINIINSPLIKGAINKNNNNNFLIKTSNQIFFTKMRITGINSKKNKKELSVNNQLNRINIDNNDEIQNRNSSYNKNIRPIIIENKNDVKDLSNKDKIILAMQNFNNNININKHITFKKLNEAEYNRAYGGNTKGIDINLSNNLKNNNHMNQDINMHNMKPLVLKTDKFQQQGNNINNINNNINIKNKNITGHKMNNKGIKFNNIIKVNTYGINNFNYKIKNLQNLNINLKNIKLKKLKTDEIKIRKPMPTLTGNVSVGKNNKIFEENNYVRQRRFITNDNVGRRSNLNEHKKYGSSNNNKIELGLTKKNPSEFDKILLLNNIK